MDGDGAPRTVWPWLAAVLAVDALYWIVLAVFFPAIFAEGQILSALFIRHVPLGPPLLPSLAINVPPLLANLVLAGLLGTGRGWRWLPVAAATPPLNGAIRFLVLAGSIIAENLSS